MTWATLMALDIIDREIGDPAGPGIALDTPERREVAAVVESSGILPDTAYLVLPFAASFLSFASRADVIARDMHAVFRFHVGDYRRGVLLYREHAAEAESVGRVAYAVGTWAAAARFHVALGEFAEAREARRRGKALAERLPEPSTATAQLVAAEDEWRIAMDDGWDCPMESGGPGMGEGFILAWYRASVDASVARTHARMGRVERALRRLSSVLPAIERAPAWAENYTRIACDAAETLWLTEHTDWIDVIERNLRDKVIAPDFHYPMMDGRLALARLCAVQGRHDEAVEWFVRARSVLDEQGARPLRAITDFDEALMYVRRGTMGDRERAAPLLDTALQQFRTLGMTGWIRRAEALRLA